METRVTTHAQMPGAHEAPRYSGLQLMDRIGATSIYSAREYGTGRGVVLKVIDDAAPTFAHDALEREAGYLAMLGTHPHIVTLYQRTVLCPTGVPRSCWRPAPARSPTRSANSG